MKEVKRIDANGLDDHWDYVKGVSWHERGHLHTSNKDARQHG